MKLSRRLALSNNFGGTGVGGLIVGPTVQLAGVPATLSLAHGATGSALAGTPKDVNGVATSDRKYYHSSDETIVTVDPDTGVPTGVAAGSATIIENFVAPVVSSLAEPIITGTGDQDMIWTTDLSEYAGMSMADVQAYGGGDPASGPVRIYPPFGEPFISLTTRPDGTGVGFDLRSVHHMPEDTYTYGILYVAPTRNNIANPGHGPVFNRLARHLMQHRWMMTTDAPITGPFRTKHVEFWHQWGPGRIQACLTNLRPGTSSHLTHFQFVNADNLHLDSVSLSCDPDNPGDCGSGSQAVGPYIEEVANSGIMYRCTYDIQPSTKSPGTVSLLLQGGSYFFDTDLTAAGLVVGDRIKITGMAKDGGGTSTADFQLVSGSGTLWTIARMSDIGTSHGPYTIIAVLGNAVVTQTAVFSQSRAGVLTTGAHGGWVTTEFTYYYEVSDFNGTDTCTLTRNRRDSNDLTCDIIGVTYSDTHDGHCRMWVATDSTPLGQGTLVSDISRAAIGVTPPGGEGPFCRTLGDVASAVPVNDGIESWIFMGPQTQGESMNMKVYGPILWAVTGGRGSWP